MKKEDIKKIEEKAQRIMDKSLGRRGDRILLKIAYEKMGIKPKSLPIIYYYILEDANYHTEAQVLDIMGAFKNKYGEKWGDFVKYKKSGGMTWQL